MNLKTQNSAFESLVLNLNNPVNLVDGRSREDELNFISQFAELINFYDNTNTVSGNWSPFILKDPVFIAVQMSQSKAAYKARLFSESCITLDGIINQAQTDKYAQSFNYLFNQILDVFREVQTWTAAMELAPTTYNLRTYTLDNVEDTFSTYLWAIIGLRYYLSGKDIIPGIYPPEMDLYNDFDQSVWKTNKDKRPYWEVLGQESKDAFDSPESIFAILRENGNYIFSFFTSLSQMAKADLAALSETPTNFPDTLLLRAFVQLLQESKSQLNGLTNRHLDFYYADILKQEAKQAQPDQVFTNLVLAKTDKTYTLNEGTLFSAGLDANKETILFENTETLSINPAVLNSVYTLTPSEQTDGRYLLYKNQNTTPTTVSKDDQGAVQSWETFGSVDQNNDKEISTGIAFASPLLYMAGGERTLTVTFNFLSGSNVDTDTLKDTATFYLSTASSWLDITTKIQPNSDSGDTDSAQDPTTDDSWKIVFQLTTKDPAIAPYSKCPDGYQSEWPLLKVMFGSYASLDAPPCVQSLTIETAVTGLTNFTLSNENGSLNPSKPFQVFGPVANVGSTFYIGNNEMFSKPIDNFKIGLTWDGLPSDFKSYYAQYNAYLNGNLTPIPVKAAATANSGSDTGGSKLPWWLKWLPKIATGIGKLFSKSKDDDTTAEVEKKTIYTFKNSSFKVDFDLLEDQTWTDLSLISLTNCSVDETAITCSDTDTQAGVTDKNNLFNEDTATETVLGSTVYEYVAGTDATTGKPKKLYSDPFLQQATSTGFKAGDEAGFLRMTLADPSEGFGNTIYPQVVSMVALVNADTLMNTPSGDTPNLIPSPGAPFIPTAKNIAGEYSASQTYTFDFNYNVNDTSQIIECYQYGAFENYMVYNTQVAYSDYNVNAGSPIVGLTRSMGGMNMYPLLAYQGVLFFALTNVIVGNQVSFYFELAETEFRQPDSQYTLRYFYWGVNGWTTLKVLSDSTRNLTCSGTIVFDFPSDMNTDSEQMPSNSFWCAVGLKGNAMEIANTSYLQTNGVQLTRTGTNYLADTTKPSLAADQIKSPATAIPEISKIEQPFASFGGRAAETWSQRNLRVSNRIKTKGKSITMGDYKRLIAENFDDVFYSKLLYDRTNRVIQIYLVKSVEDAQEKNAFLPLVTNCTETQVSDYLKTTSGFTTFNVQNFNIKYLIVNATVYINSAYELESTALRITQALKVFLSPWIKSDSPQVAIDQKITNVQVTEFIESFTEVSSVGNVDFNLSTKENYKRKTKETGVSSVEPDDPSILIVPDVKQLVKCKPAV